MFNVNNLEFFFWAEKLECLQIYKLLADMKLVVWKNHLGGQILYRSLDPSKKRRHSAKSTIFPAGYGG